jgi:aspartate carbamoyltransferase catalytic subunit
MIKLSRLTKESIVKILEEGLDFANGKVMKAKSDVFVANLFLKTVPERK